MNIIGLGCLVALIACSSPDPAVDRRIETETNTVQLPSGDTAGMPRAVDHGAHAAAGESTTHTQHAQETRPHRTHEQASDHHEHRAPAHTPEHMQHDTATHMPENMEHDTAAHAPEHMAHDTAAHMPEHMAHDTAAHAPGPEMTQADTAHAEMEANMIMGRIGSIDVMTMAQVFPTFTFTVPAANGTALDRTGFYLTQPVVTANLSSPRSAVVLRTTLNFEGVTQEEGELTWGAWGEGFLDKRHPHTLLHELMLSVNLRRATSAFSFSAGKGFPPYGTDDPMSRPVLKYPTNHHLSQALERWTVIGTALVGSWSAEAGVFGGTEPTGPYDFSNIESFPNSWSARVTKRFGVGQVGTWPWELSVSHAYVVEEHDAATKHTSLLNAAVRHEGDHGGAHLYALVEASRADPEHGDSYSAVLAEASIRSGRHLPYARVEYAIRPEYQREGAGSEKGFFRYDHDDEPVGATRWLIVSGGYGLTLTNAPVSPRPYIEVQYNRAWSERGGVDPVTLFGRSSFWSISAGTRIFIGGEPMRMGSYGILDSMTAMHDMPTLHAMSKHRH
jgi:hypothetical protein